MKKPVVSYHPLRGYMTIDSAYLIWWACASITEVPDEDPNP